VQVSVGSHVDGCKGKGQHRRMRKRPIPGDHVVDDRGAGPFEPGADVPGCRQRVGAEDRRVGRWARVAKQEGVGDDGMIGRYASGNGLLTEVHAGLRRSIVGADAGRISARRAVEVNVYAGSDAGTAGWTSSQQPVVVFRYSYEERVSV